MENATKALYIAAGVLMGIMILSLGVILFSSLQSYIDEYKEEIEFNELNTFNNKYQKYVATEQNLTIQDIITVAGIAYEDNSSFNIDTSEWDIDENSLYVGIFLDGERVDKDIKEQMQALLSENIGKNMNVQLLMRSIIRLDEFTKCIFQKLDKMLQNVK